MPGALISMHEEERNRIWCKNGGIAFGKEQGAANISVSAWKSGYVDADVCTLVGVNEEKEAFESPLQATSVSSLKQEARSVAERAEGRRCWEFKEKKVVR